MWANPGSEGCAGKVNRQVGGGRVPLVCCLGGEGGGGMDSNAEDSVIKLPEKNVPLYSHSLPCIEAWLKTMDFFQSKDDRAIWLIERSDWHAQLSLDITDLYIRWVSTFSSICASTSIDFQPASQQELQCDAASGVMMMAVARDDVRQMHWEKEKKLSVWAVRCGQSWQNLPISANWTRISGSQMTSLARAGSNSCYDGRWGALNAICKL